ncbi:MAG: DUF1801 domain-containing protein [Candidatus Acidiferrum sp.]
MKKPEPKGGKSSGKSKAKPETIDEYLSQVPEPGRSTLGKIRAAIRNAVPSGATEVISYGMPAFRHDGVVIWFAAFAKHCSLFPTPGAIRVVEKELKGCTISKGTIQFPLDKPLAAGLVKKIVKARLAQMAAKKKR